MVQREAYMSLSRIGNI